MTDLIHLRREPSPIECGATGPVRITRALREVTCQDCLGSDTDRRHRTNCDVVGCATCRDLGIGMSR